MIVTLDFTGFVRAIKSVIKLTFVKNSFKRPKVIIKATILLYLLEGHTFEVSI